MSGPLSEKELADDNWKEGASKGEASKSVISQLKSVGNSDWSSKNPEGLTDNVSQFVETPDEVLTRLLMEGEEVVQQFDCYFPGFMIPKWKIILLIIGTLGLYLIVIGYRELVRWCYRNRCCTPKTVEMTRGKLAITNQGRVICWSMNGFQNKLDGCCLFTMWRCFCPDLCAAPVEYNVKTQTRIYSVSNIRQMSYFYESSALCCCCCLSYECGISVSFEHFNTELHTNGNYGVTTRNEVAYNSTMRTMLNNVMANAEVVKRFAEGLLDLTSNQHVVHVLSGTEDVFFNGDVHGATEALVNLNKALVVSLAETIPDVFDASVASGEGGNYSFTDSTKGVSLVEAGTGKVTIPKAWFPLLEGEKVISALGQVYIMSCFDWVLAIVTLGYHYCKNVAPKKKARSALIVTTKRIVELMLYQSDGKIPDNLNNVAFVVNTFLPGHVHSGYMRSIGKGERYKNLTASIFTSGGEINIEFWDGMEALPFAKTFSTPISRTQAGAGIEWPTELSNADFNFDKAALNLFPLLPDEGVRTAITSTGKVWEPFCNSAMFLLPWNCVRWSCGCDIVSNVCSKESLGYCWHFLPYFLCCALRPFQTTQHLVITDTSIISYTPTRNFGLCGFNECGCDPDKPFITIGDYTVAWTPITNMMGYNVDIEVAGKEDCCKRLCRTSVCGSAFCPISDSTYTVTADLGEFNFLVGGQQVNHNWNKDPSLSESIRVLGKLVAVISEKKKQPVPAAMERV